MLNVDAQANMVWDVAIGLARRTDCHTVFDVGAHEGSLTAAFLQALPAARVFAFEPDPVVFERLQSRHKQEPRVIAVNAALGAGDGRAEFHRGAATYISSLFPRNQSGRRYYQSDFEMVDRFPVTVRTLDSFCAEKDVRHINLLKLDTQGGEFNILKGANGLLGRSFVDVLVTEFFFISHYEGVPLLDEIWGELRRHGYDMFDLFHGVRGANGQARFGDAIFVSPRFRAKILDAFPAEP